MARKLFITDNNEALNKADIFFPYTIMTRDEIKKIADVGFGEYSDVVLDGTDTYVLDLFPQTTNKSFLPDGLDFNGDIDRLNKSFADGQQPYETPRPVAIETSPEDVMEGGVLSATLPPSAESDELADAEIPMSEQIALLDPLLEGKRIGAGTIAELTAQLVDLCKKNDLFVRDIITGLFRSRFARKPLISVEQAHTIFDTHFCDKLTIRTTNYKVDKTTGETVRNTTYRRIKTDELKLLWKNISLYSIFNSRKEFYESIPEWDGVPRIPTFMKKYFECDTNPNFFLLLMTCIIGKIINPARTLTPFFFDIVSESKGIGKSYLCKRLLMGKYCGFLRMSKNRGMSDFFVDAYDGNNVLVVDDECTWCGSSNDKLSYDEFKSLVTTTVDKFSRKMQQPEEHDRSFIIMRTSNYVNQVYATNERRQIIFQCNLQNDECRIRDLPDSFFEQMLAEAKQYYIEHGGIYQLTDDDKLEVKAANLDNYNWETKENYAILEYAAAVRAEPDKYGARLVAQKFQGDLWGSFQKYCEWCDAHRKPSLLSRQFWRSVTALAQLPENHLTVLSDTKYEFMTGGKARVFRVDLLNSAQKDNTDELLDIPY